MTTLSGFGTRANRLTQFVGLAWMLFASSNALAGFFAFTEPQYLLVGSPQGSKHAVTADFDADGNPDLAIAFGESPAGAIFFGDGSGTTITERRVLAMRTASQRVAVADLNTDGDMDLAFLGATRDLPITYFLNQGAGVFGGGIECASGTTDPP